jgi:predicted Mrr-cat superfamily restriction endonuclease
VAPRYEELMGMSKADLITAYNDATRNVVIGLEWYRFELWRREAASQTKAVIWLTGVMTALTAANVVVAVVVVAKA